MKKQLLIILTLLSVLATGCYEDQDNSLAPVTVTQVPDVKIQTTVYGIVVDNNGATVDNYTISTDEISALVDQEVFQLDLSQANKKNQHISIVQNDQEIAFANVSLIENDYNKIQINTFPEWTNSNSVQANNVLISNNFFEVKPNIDQSEQVSYGIIDNVNTLQQMGRWARGKEAGSFFLNPLSGFYYNDTNGDNDISVFFLENNNTNVGLFHLDNDFHQWVLVDDFTESNQAISTDKSGYYMIANYTSSTFIEGKISYSETPVAYQNLTFQSPFNQEITSYTSANGRWSSYVPEDVLLNMQLLNPCGDLVNVTSEIQTANNEVFALELNSSSSDEFLFLNFKNIDCNGDAIEEPAVQINFDDKDDYFLFGQENIETVFSTCGAIDIRGFDIKSNMKGNVIEWDSTIPDNLGVLTACEAIDKGYSYITINGEEELLPTFALSENNGNLTFSAEDSSFRIKIRGTEKGEYTEEEVNIFIEDEDFGMDGYFMQCENSPVGCGITDCYISHLEDMDDDLTRVSFSGVLWMQTINNPTAGNYPVEGQIIIKQ